jgi:dolichol-phosphate mannosyltransferase
MMLSVVTPAFNEEANLEALHRRLIQSMAEIGGEWEWLVIDDHSRDGTFASLQRLAALDPRVKGVRLARNSGSHVAITCGLHHVRGDAAVMMAADLQDPPEALGALVEAWRRGAQIVWAVRRQRPGDRAHRGFAAIYYWMMRHVAGMKEMPSRGADFFLIDRVAIDAFRKFRERNVSVLALITSLGFRQEFIEYDKQPRVAGRSGWTLARKVTLLIDSIAGFSAAPIRAVSLLGLVLCAAGMAVGLIGALLLPSLGGGLLLLLAAVVGVGGLQLLAIGVVGEYVWRALEQARRRPAYLIEEVAGLLEPVQHTVE